jgi:hypothetical protein
MAPVIPPNLWMEEMCENELQKLAQHVKDTG